MAACTLYTSVTASGAGTSSINGVYLSAGVDPTFGNSVYTKDGNLNSFPKLWQPSGTSWSIYTNVPFPNAPAYTGDSGDCPVGVVFTAGPFGSEPGPTITGDSPAPDPYAPWGGFANYQRLRFLEYL